MTIKIGDRVKMTDAFKSKIRGRCLPGNHVDPFVKDQPDDGCLSCSTAHIEEFGNCIGVVEGLIDYNNIAPDHHDYDPKKIGPEWDVRWQPSNLRYAYASEDLEVVK